MRRRNGADMPVRGRGNIPIAENFNLLNELNILRIICGAFFVPRNYARIFVPAAPGFFAAAEFRPPALWTYIAFAIEAVPAICLIFALFTSYVARVVAAHMGVAGAAVCRATGSKWLRNAAGYEYRVFWAQCCVVVAMHG